MVRCMLKEREVPKEFWGEAVACAMYMLNRFSTKRIGDSTPNEPWNSKKPKVEHLKVFGSIAYAKAPEEKRKKLEDKNQKCIFLGYGDNANGYMVPKC